MKNLCAAFIVCLILTFAQTANAVKDLGTTPDGGALLFVDDEQNFEADGTFKFSNVLVDEIIYQVQFKHKATNASSNVDFPRPSNHPSSEVILPVTGENALTVEGDYEVRVKVINLIRATGETWSAPDESLAEFALSYKVPVPPTPTPTPPPPTPTPVPPFIPLPLQEDNVRAETDFNETSFRSLGAGNLLKLLQPR